MAVCHCERPDTTSCRLVVLLSVAAVTCRGAGSAPAQDGGRASKTPDAVVRSVADTCRGQRQRAWTAVAGLCLIRFAEDVPDARAGAFSPSGDLFVVSRGRILVLFDDDGDGVSGPNERETFVTREGLNHGIAFHPDGRWLYASTAGAVWRWEYRAGQRSSEDRGTAVVTGIPEGGHTTRTLAFDNQRRLYVSVGSAHNVDTSTAELASRSMVRRFDVNQVAGGGTPYRRGQVFASGLRNEVGLLWDAQGRFWGVENERDELRDDRFGGDIHRDNPADELNRLDEGATRFYGYPQCWSAGILPGSNPGEQHADQSLPRRLLRSDAWCQQANHVVAPVLALPAHWAPLGLTQLATAGPFPPAWRGDLFIASHGSWNRQPATGRLVARAHVEADGSVTSVKPILAGHDPSDANAEEWEVRPVDIHVGPDGALYFTDDAGGAVYRIGYRNR